MASVTRKINQGFSLLEMTVVLAIVGIMTAILILNMPEMKGGMSIDVVAQEVGIYVRGAQVYSRATKKSLGDENPDLARRFHSFGLHFERGSSSFFLWTDKTNKTQGNSPDYQYEAEVDGAAEETYTLPKGFVIDDLASIDVGDDDSSVTGSLDTLDIVFISPDPEANFAACRLGECSNDSAVRIVLKSPNLAQIRHVEVWRSGQIAVSKPPTP